MDNIPYVMTPKQVAQYLQVNEESVLISASYSLSGGSALLVRLCELGELTAVASIGVFNEVERNLRESFPAEFIQQHLPQHDHFPLPS